MNKMNKLNTTAIAAAIALAFSAGAMAQAAGAAPLPRPVRDAMRVAAGIMKAVAYRV